MYCVAEETVVANNSYIRIFSAILIFSTLFIMSCTDQGDKPDPTIREENILYLFNWNHYIAPETVKRFERSCNCNLSQNYYSDNEELLAKLAAGAVGYDLIVPTGNAMDSLIRQGVLKPLNKSLLSNFKNIHPAHLNTRFDPGNIYSVPYAYTLTLLGFNEEKIRDLSLPVNTWAIIFEPKYLKKLKGRVTVLDSQRELMAAALKYLGYSVNDTNEEHWNQAKELIIRAKPYWAAFSNTSYIRELASGNLWVAHGYSNDMYQVELDAKRSGRKFTIGYSTPKEGGVLSLDSMVLHQSGVRADLAHKFINFMLDGKNSAQLTNLIGSGNPNMDAIKFIEPDIISNSAVFPDEKLFTRLEMLQDFDQNQRRLLNRLWTEIKLR